MHLHACMLHACETSSLHCGQHYIESFVSRSQHCGDAVRSIGTVNNRDGIPKVALFSQGTLARAHAAKGWDIQDQHRVIGW